MAGQGKKTRFDGMTHEQMLAWLDEADAGTVQAAADKLASAAKEIHSIAEELKIRPQWVKWKGEGADSFRVWAGKLANATVALGDYSQDSSKWLGHAAEAIGKAKTSVPRDKNVDANIDSARSAHNDPDAQTILSKNMAVRQQTADEMEKLGQAYSLSTSQMAAARKPDQLKFPPPPTDIQDPDRAKLDGGGYRQRPGTGAQGATDGGAFASGGAHSSGASPASHATATGSTGVDRGGLENAPLPAAHGSVAPPARMGVDSVGVLPETSHTPSPTTSGPPVGPNPVNPGPSGNPAPGLIPPVAYGNGAGRGPGPAVGSARGLSPTAGGGSTQRPTSPTASGATGRPSNTGGRGPMMPGQNQTAAGRPGTPGRLPTTNGVAGGRPQPATGRPTTSIPRGKVMGGESATGGRNATTGQGPVGGSRPSTTGAGPRGGTGRRVGGATGDNGGIVGGRAQQQSRANARTFSSGGSGLVRGQGGPNSTSSDESQRSGQTGRSGVPPHGSRPGPGRDEKPEERPGYVTEDEQTWTPDDRRNVPSVVDDPAKNSER
ncbi:hypothetical protein OG698_28285 [Streptomyces sp. NBC_01003]|uniref:hypothetical protein n=1 Tax=Streptomyces sp. NBC_01003 TaxID=2903714 RepID=UPI003867186D|nr:hypothetical protein OG698_28285 [Streptomyces sp. NBC_01003]